MTWTKYSTYMERMRVDESREKIRQRLRAKLQAKKEQRTGGGGVSGGNGAAHPDVSREDLQRMYAACRGDVNELMSSLGLPPQCAALAEEYATTNPDHRDLQAFLARAQALMGSKK